MALPASEIIGWMDYFSIYPFTQDREDVRMARICEMINNTGQGLVYKGKTLVFFIPDYLGERSPITSEQEQIKAEKEFAAKYLAAQEKARGA